MNKSEIKNSSLTFVISSLVIVGLTFIYSSSSVYALEKFGSAQFFLKKQLLGTILGFLSLLAFQFVPIKFLKYISPIGFLASLFLTAFTFLTPLGQSVNGSSRWLKIWKLTFQPSDLLKLFFILYISYLLEKSTLAGKKNSFNYIKIIFIASITALVLLKQPDFGHAVVLFMTALMMLFNAGYKLYYIGLTILAFAPALVALILFKSYRLKRLLIFLDPWKDPQGSGFQIIQSLVAIGSGGLTGVGIAESRQKFFYLPMQHTDFIFSIIAEETGFIGCTILISLYISLLYIGLRTAAKIENLFCSYTIFGFTLIISIQAIINIAVTTGVAPTKGLALPFVSYGNSSLVCNLAIVGIMLNCMLNNKKLN